MDTMQTDANCLKFEDSIMFIQVKHALHLYKYSYLNIEIIVMVELQHPNILDINTTSILLHDNPLGVTNPSENLPTEPPLWEVLLDQVLKVERKPKASCPRKVDSSNAQMPLKSEKSADPSLV